MSEKSKVVLATATPGGGFPAYGWPYAEILNETDPTLAIEPVDTNGMFMIHPGVLKYMRELGLLK